MKYLLFIPSYNCEKQIVRVLEKVNVFNPNYFFEIIVINNISQDNTLEKADACIKSLNISNARTVTNSSNIGLGGSHKMAFQYAIDNDFLGCFVLHGDDQGDIFDINSFNIKNNYNCFNMGARFLRQSKLQGYSRFRIIGNIIFNTIASFITFRRIPDFGGSGLNYFPCEYLKKHNFWNYSDGLTFHVYLLLKCH